MDPLNIQEYGYFMGRSPQFSHCPSGLRKKNNHSPFPLLFLSLTLSLPLRILTPVLFWPFLPDPCLSRFSAHVLSRSVVSDSLWPMDCSPPGSSVHGILQARILEWVAMPSPQNDKPLKKLRSPCLLPENLVNLTGKNCVNYFVIW